MDWLLEGFAESQVYFWKQEKEWSVLPFSFFEPKYRAWATKASFWSLAIYALQGMYPFKHNTGMKVVTLASLLFRLTSQICKALAIARD